MLVILGLLTGGILAAQSLIRAAELRSVNTEYNRYITASQAFRDKYFALPGDFSSATRFWSRMNGNADCVTNSSASRLNSGVWFINGATGTTIGTATVYQLAYGNKFLIGAVASGSTPENPVLKPEEAWNFDTKFDDGKPAYGSVIASNWATCTLSSSNTDYAKDYLLSSSAVGCSLRFKQAF